MENTFYNLRLSLPRLVLRALTPRHAGVLHRYVVNNRQWLEAWEPAHSRAYYTKDGQRFLLKHCMDEHAGGNVLFGVFLPNNHGTMVGRASIGEVLRGAWQSGVVGYSVGKDQIGQGYGVEILQGLIAYAFDDLQLHRLQASVMPDNGASIQVLRRCGFRHEGHALRYLYINGVWEDHDIYALTIEDQPLPDF